MEMNDILNGLNSCDDDCCDSMLTIVVVDQTSEDQEWEVFQEVVVVKG